MLASSVLRRARSIATPALSCVRYRHPETRPSDTTIDLTPDQKLVQRPLKRPPGRLSNVTIVYDRPIVNTGQDATQPRRKNLLRPRWPEEFVIEPVQQAKYAIVALETAALGHKSVKASQEFIVHNIERGIHRLFVRYYPDYPMSRIPQSTRHGEGKCKVMEHMDYVMAGRVLFEFDAPAIKVPIIFDGVFKRMPIAIMLVKGEDHEHPSKVTDVGRRDRFGLKIYNYKIEYADGKTSDFKLPKGMYKDHHMREATLQDMQLKYDHFKHKGFGNDRKRDKYGTPH